MYLVWGVQDIVQKQKVGQIKVENLKIKRFFFQRVFFSSLQIQGYGYLEIRVDIRDIYTDIFSGNYFGNYIVVRVRVCFLLAFGVSKLFFVLDFGYGFCFQCQVVQVMFSLRVFLWKFWIFLLVLFRFWFCFYRRVFRIIFERRWERSREV